MKEFTFNRPVLHASSFVRSGGRVCNKTKKKTLAAGPREKKYFQRIPLTCVYFQYLHFVTEMCMGGNRAASMLVLRNESTGNSSTSVQVIDLDCFKRGVLFFL